MATPQAVSDHYEEQKRLAVAALAAAKRQWGRMGGDWDASWREVAPRMVAVMAAAQLGSARQGAAYVPEALAQQGMRPQVLGRVVPQALAGRAADGRPLDSLLSLSVLKSRQAGDLDAGWAFLEAAFESEIEDAARQASVVAMAARPKTGWVRVANTPCCADCAVLAGKFYKVNEGFLRHPHCRCFHLPTTVANPDVSGPSFDPPVDQITGLSASERKALDLGADLSQVVNSRRGASKMTTAAGTTSRSASGRALGARRGQRVQRLSPEGVMAIASDDDEARALLRRFGYLR